MSCWTAAAGPRLLPGLCCQELNEENVGPDCASGYKHVIRLVHCLIKCYTKVYITLAEVEEIVGEVGDPPQWPCGVAITLQ
ncbi:unnamed protein product [Pleuronectes platessa]|uniref:Uncharacterized protein n=1 Tax=Pleuronectes platessa TaxID=8262 RepID=A0A9N7UP72_PLEPL|nr:unnamed protein product [Pleuronectes platessa]